MTGVLNEVLIEAKRYSCVKVVDDVRECKFDFIFYEPTAQQAAKVVSVPWSQLAGASPAVAAWLSTLTALQGAVAVHVRKLEFIVKHATPEEEK